MNSLIIFYSMSGNNKNLSEIILKKINCSSEQILEKKKRNMFTILFEMITKKLPHIQDISNDLNDFNNIILISPIWGGVPATPMISFIKRYSDQIKNYSFITLSGGSLGPNKKNLSFLENIINKKPLAFCELYINDIASEEKKNKPGKIMKSKLTKEEIEDKYKEMINEFIITMKK